MRLTNSMMISNFMRDLQSNLKRVDRLNNQLSTGKKIIQPSDDPVGALRSMQLQTIIKENEQYVDNIDQALDWIDISEMAFDHLDQSLSRIRELAIYGANDSLEPSQRESIADEVTELGNYLVQVANTTIGNRYVFSGYQTDTKPYEDYTQTYQGDGEDLKVEISKSVKIEYSVPGNKIFDDVFAVVQAVITDLNDPNGAENLSNVTLGDIDKVIDDSLSIRAELGAKQNRLELAKNRFEDATIKHTQLLSEIEDIDIAETIMNLRMQENVYRASLATGARILQPTLIDFFS